MNIKSLKVSESEKYANDKQWFKDIASHYLPTANMLIEDYDRMKINYEVLNNNLSGFKTQLDKFCNPLGEHLGQIDEEVIPFSKLHTKVSVLKGELLKRNDNHKIILLSAKAIKDKNDALINALKASVEEKLQLMIEKMQLQMQGMQPEEANKYIQDLRTQLEPEDLLIKNFNSEWEIFYSKALKFCYYDQAIKTKQLETFEDIIAVDRMIVYSGWKHGKPYIEVRNPLYTSFHKAPNEMYINKGDYISYRKALTPTQVIDDYGHLLSKDDIESLGISTTASSADNINKYMRDDVNLEMLRALDSAGNSSISKEIGTHQVRGNARRIQSNSLIWETHIEFKAYREVIFLTYLDDYSKEITVIVSKDFKIPENSQKVRFINKYGQESVKYVWVDKIDKTEYSAETLWIPRKYEVVRLGNNVYPICREVPNQTTNINSPYSSFNLSTFGAVFTSRNAPSISLLERALPSYFQYIYIKHIQNRELAKYQGAIQAIDVDQIPDSLGQDIYGEPIRDKVATYLAFLRKTNKDFYSGSQNSMGGLPPATRSPGSNGYLLGTATELMNLQQLLEYVDREIGLSMGISPQRESAFSPSTNVTDNQQAIIQSSHITEPYFYLHNEVWKQILNDYLANFRMFAETALEDSPNGEHLVHYITPDGIEELFKVTPKMLQPVDIGIFTSIGANDQKYLDYMLNNVQAFAQNAGEGVEAISTLIKSITSGASPEEVHKQIQIESLKQQKRQEAMQTQQLKSQEEIAKMQTSNREDVQKHELEKIDRKGEWDVKKAQIITYLGMDDKDLDNDGTLDIQELAQDKELKMKELEVKNKEIDLKNQQHAEKMSVEREKIKKQANQSK
jgi:hypothetical protein